MVVNKRNRWWETMDIFFLTMDGYPMTQEAIKSVIKRLANPSGVRRLHPHLLIHSYAPCGPQGTPYCSAAAPTLPGAGEGGLWQAYWRRIHYGMMRQG